MRLALLLSILITSVSACAGNPALTAECPDLTVLIRPSGIVPAPQNGYGSGDNQLAQPDDVEFLKDGSLLVSDVNNNRLQLFAADGRYLRTISADDLHLQGEVEPTGIAQDAEGFIYVSCEGAGVVVRLKPDLSYDQTIGRPCEITHLEYKWPENEDCLIKPQGLVVSGGGDVIVIDMDKSFRLGFKGDIRRFGLKKFRKTVDSGKVKYVYDREFARTQEITKVMRKSEGMVVSESRGILFIAEEKPLPSEYGNKSKFRYIAAFDLETGTYLDKLYGVHRDGDKIVSGVFENSVEGVAVYDKYLFGVSEKSGRVYIFDIDTGAPKGYFGSRAPYYCDDESDCVIDEINYNEQSIIAGSALPHLKNSWENSELASPDGIDVVELPNGEKRLAVVDQWNMRIVIYDLGALIEIIEDEG